MLFVERYHRLVTSSPFGLSYGKIGGDKFIHVQVGLAIWIAAALLLRDSLRSFRPLAIILLAESANELLDRLHFGRWNWADTLFDAGATWFWPVTLWLLLNLSPRLRR